MGKRSNVLEYAVTRVGDRMRAEICIPLMKHSTGVGGSQVTWREKNERGIRGGKWRWGCHGIFRALLGHED